MTSEEKLRMSCATLAAQIVTSKQMRPADMLRFADEIYSFVTSGSGVKKSWFVDTTCTGYVNADNP